jgi:hypothetical protein
MTQYKSVAPNELNNAIITFELSFRTSSFLYKGITCEKELDDFYIIDPSVFIRESKTLLEHGNAYNLFINNLPSWDYYPKRRNAVITSSNLQTAKKFAIPIHSKNLNHGKTYYVLPEYGSVLAIASERDIWDSFRQGLSQIGLRGKDNTLIKFNFILNSIFKSVQINSGFDSNWGVFIFNLQKVADGEIQPKMRLTEEETRMLNYLKKNRKDIIGFFDRIFNPEINGIKNMKYDEYLDLNKYSNNEIWTEAKCLLFEEGSFSQIFNLRDSLKADQKNF